MTEPSYSRPLGDADIVLRVAIVALTLATAYIHATPGWQSVHAQRDRLRRGAIAMVVPIDVAVRYRWLVRIGLAGYAATTIAAWVLQPAFYQTAYHRKGDRARADRAARDRLRTP